MFTSREPTGLRFVWHRHLRGSSGAIISLEGGLILSQGSGVGIRACANARATLEVICGLSLVTTAQRFPFYFHPPETVPIAIEQASTPNPTTRRCLSRSGLRGGSLWLERISILYENSHRRRQRMGPTRRLEYLGAEDPLGSLRRSKRRA